jgi:hypothetical protein
MAEACKACSGVGWGHLDAEGRYIDDGIPCTTCGNQNPPREPGSFTRKTQPPSSGTTYVDGPPARRAGLDQDGVDAVAAGFSEEEIVRSTR